MGKYVYTTMHFFASPLYYSVLGTSPLPPLTSRICFAKSLVSNFQLLAQSQFGIYIFLFLFFIFLNRKHQIFAVKCGSNKCKHYRYAIQETEVAKFFLEFIGFTLDIFFLL